MEVRLDRQAATLTLGFAAGDELEAFVGEMARREAFMVPLAEELPIGTRLSVTLHRGQELELALEAEVMHRFDTVSGDYGTACRLLDWSAERAAALAALAGDQGAAGEPGTRKRSASPGSGRTEGDGDAAGTGASGVAAQDAAEEVAGQPAEDSDNSESLGTSSIHRIREMNVAERARLAMRAGRQERRILLRDTSAQVLQGLVANPRLEATELLRVVRTTHVTGAVLERVARDPRWGKNLEILAAIAANPKAPSPLAVRLMPALRTGDLRRMSKMASGLRENVRRAALGEYLKRTSRR